MTSPQSNGFATIAAFGLAAGACLLPMEAAAQSIAHHGLDFPSWEDLIRVLTLQDYNTRVVIVGTTLLGFAAGLIGTFLILRKRALLSDALSHATLPGIALAFILMTITLGDGKHLLGLVAGAAVFSVLGTLSVLFIQRFSRLKDDAALGIVLSVYFGLGIALLGLATRMESGNAAGLTSFIYGKTASMLMFDALLIAGTALISALFCLLFFKEFALICFDAEYGASQGWPVDRLDFLMMAIVVVVTVIGLQAVGLILVVALLIIPAAAARFWTFNLTPMLWLSGAFGAASGMVGAGISALMANLPAGAVIVITASILFAFSMTFGSARGLLRLGLDRRRLRERISRENLLRDLFEWRESHRARPGGSSASPQDIRRPASEDLMNRRFWIPSTLRKTLRRLRSLGMVRIDAENGILLTEEGLDTAREVVRKHRLWEAYLITHADVAPGTVDLSADRVEHVLDPEVIRQLEGLFPEVGPSEMPRSPHRLRAAEGES
jgi:manganese/zinc/iron transport system permease protein